MNQPSYTIRKYIPSDVETMREIWNGIIVEGNAFPQEELLTKEEAETFFAEQSYTGVAVEGDHVLGLYILHPNNVGRCGHIANASYAVRPGERGRYVGESLVLDSIRIAASLSFHILQFNAVVASNDRAIKLYQKLGFEPLGRILGGFRLPGDVYQDILLYYIRLISV
jgi:L-amino acid N-acyltransferase YncA